MAEVETRGEKRPSASDETNDHDDRSSKRPRTSIWSIEALIGPHEVSEQRNFRMTPSPSSDNVARDGLRRSITLALEHVGFDSASEEALESMTAAVETYLTGFIEHVKENAEGARRPNPTPLDFAALLRRHNIPFWSLEPHLKNPVAKRKLRPKHYDPIPIREGTDYFKHRSMDFLGQDLDGNVEKKDKVWIPSTLPAFPSKHTYKFTEVEAPADDSDKKRADALADARKTDKALRDLERAGKLREQKEQREIAQRNPLSKQRYENWDAAVNFFKAQRSDRDRAKGKKEHSVIVDYNARYQRGEVARSSVNGRTGLGNITGKS